MPVHFLLLRKTDLPRDSGDQHHPHYLEPLFLRVGANLGLVASPVTSEGLLPQYVPFDSGALFPDYFFAQLCDGHHYSNSDLETPQ